MMHQLSLTDRAFLFNVIEDRSIVEQMFPLPVSPDMKQHQWHIEDCGNEETLPYDDECECNVPDIFWNYQTVHELTQLNGIDVIYSEIGEQNERVYRAEQQAGSSEKHG